MKFFLKLFKKKRLLTGLGFLTVILLVGVAGYRFNWPVERQAFAIILIILIWVMFYMYQRMQAAKGAASIEESIRSQSVSGYGNQEEIDQLRHQLTSAIDSLKHTKLGNGVSGKAALYALPWYMFIGPPGSGKTTAIENSGLEFPHGTDRIRGVGGTRNCDWFFSSSAILLDTAGRYTTQDEDRDEWFAFLDMLKKHRKKRPLNGVIIGISIADLLHADGDELEKYAKTIRERIDELIERLGVHFPVYLVFTKCDLIHGFVEFFEDFGRFEREQVWGASLTKEQQENPDVCSVFLTEYQKLHDALLATRLDRLNNPMNRTTRQKVYTFPLEFLSLREQLDTFVSKLFQQNPYKENPMFRGFYFTSGTQEGVPIDRVVESIARQFDLAPEMQQSFNPEMETKSYFIKDLFTDVVIPDQHLVSRSSKASKRMGFFKLGSVGIAFILLALILIGSLSSYLKFKSDTSRFIEFTETIQQIQWENGSLSENFYALDEYRQRVQNLNQSSILWRGIYRGKQIVEPAQAAYYAKLKPFIETYLYDGLIQNELTAYANNADGDERDAAYDLLRSYLLFGSESRRLLDSRVEHQFLRNQVASLVDTLLQTRFNFAFQESQNQNLDELRILIQDQVQYFVDILANYQTEDMGITPLESAESVIQETRMTLGSPSINDIYARIQRESVLETEPLTLSSLVGNRAMDYFLQDAEILGFFTQEGWDSYVVDKIREVSQTPDQDDWVLAVDAAQLPEELRDQETMERNLLEIYFAEYVDAWWNFIRRIQFQRFSDMDAAVRGLNLFGDFGDSPIQKILETVSAETQFESGIERGARGLAARVGLQGDQHIVDREFRSIHNLVENENGELNTLLGQYEVLGVVLDGLAKEEPAATVKYAGATIQQRSGDLPTAMREIQNTVRGIDSRTQDALFLQPVTLAWRNILGRAQYSLNQTWSDQVHAIFAESLAPHYPFNRNSTSEAPVADLVGFFHPGEGVFWSYVQNELGQFVRDDSYNVNTWAGYGIGISDATRQAIQKVREISRGLGLQSQGNLAIQFSVLPDLPTPAGIVEQITLAVDGTTFPYRMGRPQWTEFNWPGFGNDVGSYLEIRTKQGNYEPMYFDSQWGFFKLLDTATIRETSPSHYDVYWTFNGSGPAIQVNYKLRAASIYNPFGEDDFFNLTLPERLN
jgi:type VI secretion system protein ImpL